MNTHSFRTQLISIWMMIGILCSPLYATQPKQDEQLNSTTETTALHYAIDCAKTCLSAATGAISTSMAFLGFAGASCTAGVCPIVAATSTGGLLTASGLGAAVTAFVATAGEVCAEGISVQCMGYVAVPAIVGGVAGYLVIKGYDKAKKWYVRQQAMQIQAEIDQNESEDSPSDDVAKFVPAENTE